MSCDSTYQNKPVSFSCKFDYVCINFVLFMHWESCSCMVFILQNLKIPFCVFNSLSFRIVYGLVQVWSGDSSRKISLGKKKLWHWKVKVTQMKNYIITKFISAVFIKIIIIIMTTIISLLFNNIIIFGCFIL